MIHLTEEHKSHFWHQAQKISIEDEQKILKTIHKEIEHLLELNKGSHHGKLNHLIDQSRTFLSIIENEDFPISETSRKWLFFGLGYLVLGIDLIPDNIPGIGYMDDVVVVNWVHGLLEEDVRRFEHFLMAKDRTKPIDFADSGLASSNELIIGLPGFINYNTEESSEILFVKQLRQVFGESSNPKINYLKWSFSYLNEFSKTIQLIDHPLSLKPSFDFETLAIDWEQLKIDSCNLGHRLGEFINYQLDINPDLRIKLVSMNIGALMATEALQIVEAKNIPQLYLIGASISEDALEELIAKKPIEIHNYYSSKDHALSFLFSNFEEDYQPVGLGNFRNQIQYLNQNLNVSDLIERHQEYKYKLEEVIHYHS
jgi:uncharacterized membrane protein YkvA (DUF1232 family)